MFEGLVLPLTVALNLVFYSAVQCEPIFVEQPEDADFTEGTNAVLHCKIDGMIGDKSEYRVIWQMNNTEDSYKYIHGRERYVYQERYNQQGQHNLTIHNVVPRDAGHYRCLLYSGSHFIMWSRLAAVQVTPPQFRQHPGHKVAIKGDSVVLSCEIDNLNSDMFVVHWMKGVYTISHDRRILNPTMLGIPNIKSRYHVRGEVGSGVFDLEIQEVKQEDSGNFTCVIYRRNEPYYATKSDTVTVSVVSAPRIYPSCHVLNPRDSFVEGNDIVIACLSRNSGDGVQLFWRKDGEDKKGSLIRPDRVDVLDTWSLSANDDGAYISCVEEHFNLDKDKLCTIGPIDVKFSPIVSLSRISDKGQVADNLTFTCSAKANPTVLDYTWHVNHKPVSEALLHGQYDILEKSDRQILKLRVNLKDYTNFHIGCQATNMVGTSAAVSTIKLDGEETEHATEVDTSMISESGANHQVGIVTDSPDCMSVSLALTVASAMFFLGAFSVIGLRWCRSRYKRYREGEQMTKSNVNVKKNNDIGLNTNLCASGKESGNNTDKFVKVDSY
ncbi:kin of IRRE-like protein 1 [Ptychodera flava]|uniref:kin of IRRE-like protein 1 n=1 Tax=Ptychodera flava TaxID=63121 RepID=UPI00396A5926